MIYVDTILTINIDYHEANNASKEDRWLFGIHTNILMLSEESYRYLILDSRVDLPIVLNDLDAVINYVSEWLELRVNKLSYNETLSDMGFYKFYTLTDPNYDNQYITLGIQTYLTTPEELLDWFDSIHIASGTITFRGE